MSVNLYLDNKVRKLSGFKIEPKKDNPGEKLTYNGSHVFVENGRLYLMWSLDAPVPDDLKDLVEEISCYVWLPHMVIRESGIYRHETAECELTPHSDKRTISYRLILKAKKLEDIQALLHKVKTGTIRPEESYEDRQGGKTRKQLETDIMQTQQQLGEALVKVKELQAKVKLEEKNSANCRSQYSVALDKNDRLRQLARTIDSGSLLPLVFRSAVATQIDSILDDTK